MNELITQGEINSRIFTLRGKEVMIDEDLAELYQVELKRLMNKSKEILKDFLMILCFN